jgi:hypothetical protein
MKIGFKTFDKNYFPARNYAWEDSIKNGFKRHWIFDDNIRRFRRLNHGKRMDCNALSAIKIVEEFSDRYLNIGISGFDYLMFVMNSEQKPFILNVHIYSALLISNKMPYRWRLKYNEDVDLCLQVLHNKLCTVLFKAFLVDKTSTTAKMKGGNQTELYQGNKHEKKILKARSLEEVWPQYAKTVWKFNRPHHSVNWKKFFNHQLIRDPEIDWDSLEKVNNFGMKLKQKKVIKSEDLRKLILKENSTCI